MLEEEALYSHSQSRHLQQRFFSFLQTCNSISNLHQTHTQIIINSFSQKRFLMSKLISLYITFGFFNHAQRAFDGLTAPNTSSWNQMIRLNPSIQLLNKMRMQGCKLDEYSYSYALSGCDENEGKQIHGRVVCDGFERNVVIGTGLVNLYGLGDACKVFDGLCERNVVTWNSLIAGYVRMGGVNGAMRVFDEMPQRNVISWTTMISGCAKHGQCGQALAYFNEMRKAGVELTEVVLVATLSACAELGDLYLGRWIHSYIRRTFQGTKTTPLVSLQNTLIHMYISCGVFDEAFRVFNEIPCKTVVSWTTMILGYAKHSHGEKALSLFKLMETNQVRPDAVTFIGVLSACSHAGLVKQGGEYFKEMKNQFNIEPMIQHYGCMVDLLSRGGFLNEAVKLIQSMPMVPNNSIWGALLGGCRIHKNAEIARFAVKNLVLDCNDPHQAVGYLWLVSDVYAVCGIWKDVAAIREKMMNQIGLPKTSGRSWIQVNGIMHDFAARDLDHKHSFSIYEMLDRVNGLMMIDACDFEGVV